MQNMKFFLLRNFFLKKISQLFFLLYRSISTLLNSLVYNIKLLNTHLPISTYGWIYCSIYQYFFSSIFYIYITRFLNRCVIEKLLKLNLMKNLLKLYFKFCKQCRLFGYTFYILDQHFGKVRILLH